jgi:hypothetical protein
MNYNYKKFNTSTSLYIKTYNTSFSEDDYSNVIQIDNFIRSRSNILFYNYVKKPLFNISKKDSIQNKYKIYKSIGSDLQFCLVKNNIDYTIKPKLCGCFYNTFIDLDSIIIQEYYKLIDQYEKKNMQYPIYQSHIPSRPINMLNPKPML